MGRDFNVIRRSSEKLDGSSFTSSMRDFDGFIKDCELLEPPLAPLPPFHFVKHARVTGVQEIGSVSLFK